MSLIETFKGWFRTGLEEEFLCPLPEDGEGIEFDEDEQGAEKFMSSTELTKTIKAELSRVRDQIRAGDDSEILIWLLDKTLACSQRPLRDHPDYGGRCKPLPPEAKPLVMAWVERIKCLGIRSIVSLLEEVQHEKYYIRGGLDLHPEGLFGYYQSQGFEFCHIPMTDYQKPSEA